MSNERIDEFLPWRGRLDDPQGVPGQGLDDREATWERLMDKIREAPRRRRFFGYRFAAACVLLALIPAFRLFQERHVRVAAGGRVELRPVVVPAPVPGQKEVAAGAASAKEAVVENPRATGAVPAKEVAVAPENARTATPRKRGPVNIAASVKLAALTVVATPASVSAAAPDSAHAQLMRKSLKINPLRIVHINELPGGGGPAPAITATDAGRHFEFSLAPSKSSVSPPPADPELLKVKLPSSN